MLKELEEGKQKLESVDLIEGWKSLSSTLGKEVRIISFGETIEGKAIDVDTSGALIIKTKDGSLVSAIAGDCFHLL